jgi:hypothetical protein
VLARPPSFSKKNEPVTALDYELAQERAATLGRLGRKLESTLAALRAYDQARTTAEVHSATHRAGRHALVSDAGVALWNFVIQREVVGLRDSRVVMRDYNVPAEVQAQMGALPLKTRPCD